VWLCVAHVLAPQKGARRQHLCLLFGEDGRDR
jgi:hypothetical protein